jgi:hypothetical protein
VGLAKSSEAVRLNLLIIELSNNMVSQELYYDFIDVRIGFFFRLKTKQKHGRKEMANEVIAKYGKKEGWALRYYYVKYAARNDKLTGGIELKKVKEPYVVKNGAPEIIISRPNPLVVSQVPLQDLPDIAVWMNFPEERHGEIDIKCAEEFYVKSERKSTITLNIWFMIIKKKSIEN